MPVVAASPAERKVGDNEGGGKELRIKIERASPLDVPLLMHMVEEGAQASLFSPSYLEFIEMLRLWKRGTRASRIFDRHVPALSAPQEVLLRAGVGGETVGLLLAQVRAGGSLYIEFVTVDRLWRHRHVARALVAATIAAATVGTVITVCCAPPAKEMIGLLGRMGFRIVRVAHPVAGQRVVPYVLQLVKRGP